MDKTTTENKLGRGLETKPTVSAQNCPEKGSHASYLGRIHPPCGEIIPFGPYVNWEYYFGTRPQEIQTQTSPEENALWTEYEAVDAERARVAGDIRRADAELVSLKARATEADYKHGLDDLQDAAAVRRKITQNGVQRVQLREDLDAVLTRERVVQLKITKVGQRRKAEQQRLEATPTERPGLVARAVDALRR